MKRIIPILIALLLSAEVYAHDPIDRKLELLMHDKIVEVCDGRPATCHTGWFSLAKRGTIVLDKNHKFTCEKFKATARKVRDFYGRDDLDLNVGFTTNKPACFGMSSAVFNDDLRIEIVAP